ncbi:MAG: hypothetical protein V7784_13100 [Oceanospirillaceae bacterium]
MSEFLIVFAITLLILGGLAVALFFGRAPVYQISREEALSLLNELVNGTLTELKWLVFIGHAIPMDPQLNDLRLECSAIELAAEQGDKVNFVANLKRYNGVGIEHIRSVITDLEKLIADAPVYKSF